MVIVIDDDLSARTAIVRLVGAMGFSVKTFESGLEFLYSELPDEPSCLIHGCADARPERPRSSTENERKRHPYPSHLRYRTR